MISDFFKSVYFNAILATIAAFFTVFQEVLLGTAVPFLNIFAGAAAIAVCLSWGAEVIKVLCFDKSPYQYSWKSVLYGGGVGIVAALIFALILL